MITGTVSILAICIGVPLGIYITRNKRLEGPVINLANIGQTIPTFAVLMDNDTLLAGAIPTAILAVLADMILGRVENALVPRGIQR